jgi:hypothetical protein
MSEPIPTSIKLKELNVDMIHPSSRTMFEPKQGGSKTVVIGKPGTGKSTLIAYLLYLKKDIFPIASVFSGTEDTNHFYEKIIPSTFIHNEYNEEKIEEFVKRQKLAIKHLQNPWGVLLIDDCTDEPKVLNRKIQHALFKNGRQYKMWYILSLQYALDIKPAIRSNIDGVFLFREPNRATREKIWKNYASIIPEFSLFCELMDQITGDHTALYIHNQTQTNDWQDCVFYFRANPVPSGFKFGCEDYWKFHYDRYNPNYDDTII